MHVNVYVAIGIAYAAIFDFQRSAVFRAYNTAIKI